MFKEVRQIVGSCPATMKVGAGGLPRGALASLLATAGARGRLALCLHALCASTHKRLILTLPACCPYRPWQLTEESLTADGNYSSTLTVVTVEPAGLSDSHEDKLRLLLVRRRADGVLCDSAMP